MKFGEINLFCPICGQVFRYNMPKGIYYHHKIFGILNGKECFDAAELKYARMILGKDDV